MMERVLEVLERPRRLEEELTLTRLRAAEALDRCRRTTSCRGRERVDRGAPAGPGDERYAQLCDLMEAERRLTQQLEAAQAELDTFLDRVREECSFRDYCVLRWHYRLDRPWTKIRADLQETFGFPVTLRTAHNWHRAALQRAAELLEP